ncbi:MAG: efflux RND transporter permease subunit [Candidatus Sumerlaeia bacterium]|nr:efflux RND transporter permease subunit [Candidatus Sumerlaeia bacterium]
MIRYFIHNWIAVLVLCVTIVLFGVLALLRMPIQLTPEVRQPTVTVTTIYPGATPEDVEQDILIEQERFLRSVPGLQKMVSTASLGSGNIVLEFSVGSSMSDNLVRINNALSQVPSYPENVDEPSLSTSSSSDQPVAWFSIRAVSGKELEVDPTRHFDYAEDFVKPAFERISGVAEVRGIYGASDRQMQVFLDPVKLADRQISIGAVRQAIRSNNRDISGGDLEEGKRRYNLRTLGRYAGPADVENTIISRGLDGAPVRISDVGFARVAPAKPRSLIRHNGRPALAFGVVHQPGTNLLLVMEEVKAAAAELNEGPLSERDLRLTQVTDDTEYVRASTAMVRNNLVLGGILALMTLLLFLRHVRSTIILGIAIPLCIMGSLMLINFMGRSINVITLAGLAFSIGSVLDNSIVVLENIFRHRSLGKGPFEAAYQGVSEVWTAILSSTITNVVVFIPIITLQDEAGQLFRDLALAITCTNVFSFTVGVLVIPCLGRILFTKVPSPPTTSFGKAAYNLFGLQQIATGFYNVMGRVLTFLLGGLIRRVALVITMITVAFSLIFIFMPKTEYLPDGNQNTIFGLLMPPQGYGLSEFGAIGVELEKRIRPYVEATEEDFANGVIDGPPLQDFFFIAFGNAMFTFTRAQNPNQASQVPAMLISKMSEVPGMIPISSQMSIFSAGLSGSRGIELDIIGPNFEEATDLARAAFMKVFEVMPGAQPRPEPGIEIGQPQLSIRPNWERASELGLGADDIGYGAWVLGDGAYADEYYERGRKLSLYLYSTMGSYDSLANFESLRIAGPEGTSVPISSIADVEFGFSPQEIRRVNTERAVTINITPPLNISLEEAVGIIERDIIGALHSEGVVPDGYQMRIGGSSDKLANIREKLSVDLLLALVLVYLTLTLVLQNLAYPITILLTVPIGLTGGVLGLKALNYYLAIITPGQIQSLDVLTMLGFIILLGSVVNNPILIVEQSFNFMKEGLGQNEAIVQATQSRLRPIFMATGTTILGLTPLVVIPGAGSELYRGLGVVMFGGLLLGTATTVFFMPCILSLTLDFTRWLAKRLPGDALEKALPIPVNEPEG